MVKKIDPKKWYVVRHYQISTGRKRVYGGNPSVISRGFTKLSDATKRMREVPRKPRTKKSVVSGKSLCSAFGLSCE